MNSLTLRIRNKSGATMVSNIFIDEYMSEANGEFVKVYMYLLRCVSHNKQLSISVIADKFNHTEADVIRALKYWEKMKLVKLNYTNDILTEITFIDYPNDSTSIEESTDVETAATQASTIPLTTPKPGFTTDKASTTKVPSYSADSLKCFSENEDIKQIIFVAESYLGKTLSASEMNTLMFFYDDKEGLDFSVDLIEYLIEYCVSKGHKSINQYARQTAIAWREQEIKTVTQAKAQTIHYNADFYKVFNALGIKGRKMVTFEANYIEKWLNTYCFTRDIVEFACEQTLSTIHQPDFKYTDSILTNWHTQEVKHIDDAKALILKHQKKNAAQRATSAQAPAHASNRYSNLDQRTYDYDDLEKQLLTTK
ncbi:MAG: DnaD domain protein [Lachnotalea sp.]